MFYVCFLRRRSDVFEKFAEDDAEQIIAKGFPMTKKFQKNYVTQYLRLKSEMSDKSIDKMKTLDINQSLERRTQKRRNFEILT